MQQSVGSRLQDDDDWTDLLAVLPALQFVRRWRVDDRSRCREADEGGRRPLEGPLPALRAVLASPLRWIRWNSRRVYLHPHHPAWTRPRRAGTMRVVGAGAAPSNSPTGSTWLLDERGVALKATWRLSHGFINLSIWRDDRCFDTFHLTPADAARLIAFLVNGLADVASIPAASPVMTLAADRAPQQASNYRERLTRLDGRVRAGIAARLRKAADRLAP